MQIFIRYHPQVTQVIVHPRYVEASTSGFDIAVYKVKVNTAQYITYNIYYVDRVYDVVVYIVDKNYEY